MAEYTINTDKLIEYLKQGNIFQYSFEYTENNPEVSYERHTEVFLEYFPSHGVILMDRDREVNSRRYVYFDISSNEKRAQQDIWKLEVQINGDIEVGREFEFSVYEDIVTF